MVTIALPTTISSILPYYKTLQYPLYKVQKATKYGLTRNAKAVSLLDNYPRYHYLQALMLLRWKDQYRLASWTRHTPPATTLPSYAHDICSLLSTSFKPDGPCPGKCTLTRQCFFYLIELFFFPQNNYHDCMTELRLISS